MSGPERGPEAAWAAFDWTRERYEDMIARVVPDYHEQASLIAEAVGAIPPDVERGQIRVLELGAGTGGLARVLLQTFPQAHVTAMDVSPVMLTVCREVLAPFIGRARVVEADFATAELGSGYQAVVSRLALHHLDDQTMAELVGRVFEALVPGGVFVNADMITGAGDEESAEMMAEWRRYMTSRGDDPDEWVRWLAGEDDFPATEQAQLARLLDAGFTAARVIWKRAGFAMFRAERPVPVERVL